MIYVVLSVAIVTAVMQASLDKAGFRIEHTTPSVATNILVLLSIPITLFSNLGVIAITIWSLFVLPWLHVLGVVAVAFIGFSFLWGTFLVSLRRSKAWDSLAAAGIPIVFGVRLVCAACVVFFICNYIYKL